jgi:serine/threonine protein kinase
MKCNDIKTIIKPDINYINNILLNEYTSYSAVRALECFLTQKIDSEGKKGEVCTELNPDWAKFKEYLGGGSNGIAELYTIFEKSVIVMKRTMYKYMTKEEYEIGVNAINTLRYYCPNFMYTFFLFCEVTEEYGYKNFIGLEYCGSKTLYDFIDDRAQTIENFFVILIQILAALEIGQTECRFCHFDLSPANIMLRNDKISYSVNMGNLCLQYQDVTCPVIIDFGFSSAVGNNKIYSTFIKQYKQGEYGKFSFLIQGFDMYFLLATMACYSENLSIKKFTKEILTSIYGKTPYNFDLVNEIDSNQWGDISYTSMAALTPGRLLRILVTKYPQYSKNIKIKNRETYDINSLRELNSHFMGITNINIDLSNCLGHNGSYLTYLYYAKEEPKEKYSMLDNDRRLLLKYGDIVVPRNIINICEKVLGTVLEDDSLDIDDMIRQTEFISDIQVYIDIYYMILQIKPSEKIYSDFSKRFRESNIFRFYNEKGELVMSARRWLMTLKDFRNKTR